MFRKKHNGCLKYVYGLCFFHCSYHKNALNKNGEKKSEVGEDVTNHRSEVLKFRTTKTFQQKVRER